MMKRLPIIFFAILLSACVHSNAGQTAAEAVPDYAPEPLIISNEHKRAFRLGTNLLVNHHYRKQKLSAIASDVHLDYLQALDPSHIYFLQSDIDEFKHYGDALLQANKGDLSALLAIYQRYFPHGGISIFTFDIKGGRAEAFRFIDHLKLFSLLANVADVKSLVIHPATTTHSQMSDAELEASGIGQGTVRLSVGIEHADDLLEDIAEALAAV